MRNSLSISKYLIRAIVPYFFFAWLLLSVVLFVQQAGRFSDIFFSSNIPGQLIWQLAIALIPNVIAFTCPMAVLVGTVIGLSKLQGDSELVAIRAAGVGTIQIFAPILLLGVVLTGFTFLINLYGVPFAARIVRAVALQTAIFKLESPIEPGVFNTEVAGYAIYVKEGDLANGAWKDIFIHTQDPKNGGVRLITSKRGRIDTTGQDSELVLEDASSTTIVPTASGEKFVTEDIGQVRVAVKTKRSELLEKVSSTERSVEEMGLSELSEYARSKQGTERAEAEILWQRRLLLSVAPILFCLLGTALVLRFDRGGRAHGVFLSLLGLITFYLLAFLGEQLARTGKISAFAGSVIPALAVVMVSIGLLYTKKVLSGHYLQRLLNKLHQVFSNLSQRINGHNFFIDLTTGLRDFDIIRNILGYYVLAVAFLASIFLIFTAFELWRFAGNMAGGTILLAKYLFFLIPFTYLQLSPSAAMIATLATYVIKSRQNEIVTWTSAGQSIYRLLLPCFVLMAVLGVFNFAVQELIAPTTNVYQDNLRQKLLSRGKQSAEPKENWVADGNRIYSFSPITPASDNEKQVGDLTIYQFAGKGEKLQALYRSDRAEYADGRIIFEGTLKTSRIDDSGRINNSSEAGAVLVVGQNPFKGIRKKPSQMTLLDIGERIEGSGSENVMRTFETARWERIATLILPIVIGLFTAPFALSLDRKGKAAAVGFSVGLWLLFMGVMSVFEQFGGSGFVPPAIAVWGPLLIFSFLGGYQLMTART